jgi:hypothetical protein
MAYKPSAGEPEAVNARYKLGVYSEQKRLLEPEKYPNE